MADEFALALRMLAFDRGRAQPLAARRRVAVRREAWVLCPLAMAGEETAVHAVACGPIAKREPLVYSVPDPRRRDELFGLFAWLGARLAPYAEASLRAGAYPQIWVPSRAAVALLDTLGEYLWHAPGPPELKALARLLVYATGRAPVAGQQALHAATEVLSQHYATGQQPGEDEHLGALLTWVDPPPGVPLDRALAAAEATPMGVRTDPSFDKRALEGPVARYNLGRKRGAPAEALSAIAAEIDGQLRGEVLRLYGATRRAVRLLCEGFPERLGCLPELETIEAEAYERFAEKGVAYARPGRADLPRQAAYEFVGRQLAQENYERALVHQDPLARLRAKCEGRVVEGVVREVREVGSGLSKRARFWVESEQRSLRVRRGAELHLMADPRLKVVVEDLHRSGPHTRLEALVVAGMRAAGPPAEGDRVELGPAPPVWYELTRGRVRLSHRIAQRPWTHDRARAPDPPPQAGDPPPNLLRALEALR
ncbi:MAG TPA: hypothetical protein VFS43_35265 [Polyangiaceae bacterium]|nr:hypothetical protein [Polyangiaceae bacterium]